MISGLIFVLFSISPASSATSAAGFFDLAEFRKVSYDSSIGDNLLWFAPDLDIRQVSPENIDDFERRIKEKLPSEKEGRFLFVTSKRGQKFACSLPEVEDLKKSNTPKSSTNPRVYGELLAASFYVNKCITLRGNAWWSYVLCRGLTVEQFHGEPERDGYMKNILGLFDGNLTMPSYTESTEDRLLYVEESYSAGTFCDLEDYKEPRTARVRYECDPSLSTNEAYVHSVVEVKPCHYIMIVKVGTLCSFPDFLPASQTNTQKIQCQPYLSQTEIRSLLQKQLDEKRIREELEEEERELRHEFQVATDRYMAMSKSHRVVNLDSMRKVINAEMDYNAANFDLIVLGFEKNEGKDLSRERLAATWDLLKTVDVTDYTFYVDYESIHDENRGHLWYYFHDPVWPKDQFPKDILATAIQNGYIKEVQELMKERFSTDDIDKAHLESFISFVKTGVFNLDLNLVITAEDILENIAWNGTRSNHAKWMKTLYHAFLHNSEKVYKKLIWAMGEHKNKRPVFGGLAKALLPEVLEDIDENVRLAIDKGTINWSFTPITGSLKVNEAAEDSKSTDADQYELRTMKDLPFTMTRLLELYIERIAPFYHMLSIMYFQDVYYPSYFHPWPPSMKHLYSETEYESFIFHESLAKDAINFAKLLTTITLMKMEHEIHIQRGKTKPEFTTASMKEIVVFGKSIEKLWDFDNDDYVFTALSDVFDFFAQDNAREARERLWKKKTERYRMEYWVEDYKKRKEAKAMHKYMHSLLKSVDESSTIQTVGGFSKKKKRTFNEKELVDILNKDEESQTQALLEKLAEGLLGDDKASIDEEEWGAMKEVFDLLGKAGLNKDVEVQIRMFDQNGVEIINEELNAKDFLEDADSIVRFKASEKAYAMKVSAESEDDE